MMALSAPVRLLLGLGLIGLAAFPWIGESYYQDLVIRLMILGIFAMSLDLLIGYTGLVSFGHAAFFGLSGYLLAMVTPADGPVSLWWALAVCLGGTATAALVIGWFSVRTRGAYFIMITLAFAQMLYYFFNESPHFGGSDGIFLYTRPSVEVFGLALMDLSDPLTFYYAVLASLVGAYALLRRLLNAPFGQIIRSVKTNDVRTRALGFNTRAYQLASFTIAGTLAGFAGFLEAAHTGIISPGHLHWHESGLVMVTVILGGMGTLHGPVLGAFVLGLLQDWLQDAPFAWMADHLHLTTGLFVIAVVLFLPRGLIGLFHRRDKGGRS